MSIAYENVKDTIVSSAEKLLKEQVSSNALSSVVDNKLKHYEKKKLHLDSKAKQLCESIDREKTNVCRLWDQIKDLSRKSSFISTRHSVLKSQTQKLSERENIDFDTFEVLKTERTQLYHRFKETYEQYNILQSQILEFEHKKLLSKSNQSSTKKELEEKRSFRAQLSQELQSLADLLTTNRAEIKTIEEEMDRVQEAKRIQEGDKRLIEEELETKVKVLEVEGERLASSAQNCAMERKEVALTDQRTKHSIEDLVKRMKSSFLEITESLAAKLECTTTDYSKLEEQKTLIENEKDEVMIKYTTVTKSLEEETENIQRERALQIQMKEEIQIANSVLDGLRGQIKELAQQKEIENSKNKNLRESNESNLEAAKLLINPLREDTSNRKLEIEKLKDNFSRETKEVEQLKRQEMTTQENIQELELIVGAKRKSLTVNDIKASYPEDLEIEQIEQLIRECHSLTENAKLEIMNLQQECAAINESNGKEIEVMELKRMKNLEVLKEQYEKKRQTDISIIRSDYSSSIEEARLKCSQAIEKDRLESEQYIQSLEAKFESLKEQQLMAEELNQEKNIKTIDVEPIPKGSDSQLFDEDWLEDEDLFSSLPGSSQLSVKPRGAQPKTTPPKPPKTPTRAPIASRKTKIRKDTTPDNTPIDTKKKSRDSKKASTNKRESKMEKKITSSDSKTTKRTNQSNKKQPTKPKRPRQVSNIELSDDDLSVFDFTE